MNLKKIFKSLNRKMKKTHFFLLYSVIYCGIIYMYLPTTIFYFYEIKGKAQVEFVDKENVNLSYYHKGFEKNIELEYKVYNLKKRKKLKSQIEWDILYSKYSTGIVSIIGVDSKPGPLGLFPLLLFLLPFTGHKRYEEWAP